MSLREEHYEIFPEDRPDGVNHSDPFSNPRADNYCSEREAKVYLTREDIKELGFLRSNPDRAIYQHTDKPTLYLESRIVKDYSIKDFAVEEILLLSKRVFVQRLDNIVEVLYKSTKPNKEKIQQIIDNYAG